MEIVDKSKQMKIGIAADHAGYLYKQKLIEKLEDKGFIMSDFGCQSEESCDYPDFAHPLAEAIENGEMDMGISICGSGNGINMVVNKYAGIRSAICWNEEIALLARTHNNANICALPARFVSFELAWKMVEIFINTEFEGGRHQRRIEKIPIA
jgi:ribose 5-phosphate isomerase B